jgi:hypothetical protein
MRREEEENPRSHAAGLGRTVNALRPAAPPFHKMSARLVLAGRLGLDPGARLEPRAKSAFSIWYLPRFEKDGAVK